ncbi:MAG: tRNA 4-thiouridine(8) synthase ThiI, partial [Clostridia bacterium]|nr:tRNA 4-thiouridine(8) synthase ThiI [Clostridia bacterium]
MKVVLIRYSEIHLKGKNRGFFERALVNNIKRNLQDFDYCLSHTSGRYVVSQFDENFLEQIVDAVKNTFGVYSLSVADEVPTNMDAITTAVLACAP